MTTELNSIINYILLDTGRINKRGDPTRRRGMGTWTGSLNNRKRNWDYATSGYTAQELMVIEEASESVLPSDEPLLYPDMYNLQKGVVLTKGKDDCENRLSIYF